MSVIFTQLKLLEKEGYLTSKKIEDKSKFPMQRLRIYSVNWPKIIEEFDRFYNKLKQQKVFNKLNLKKPKLNQEILKETLKKFDFKGYTLEDIFHFLILKTNLKGGENEN